MRLFKLILYLNIKIRDYISMLNLFKNKYDTDNNIIIKQKMHFIVT